MEHLKKKRRDRINFLRYSGLAQLTVEGKRTRSESRCIYIEYLMKDVGRNSYKKIKDIMEKLPR